MKPKEKTKTEQQPAPEPRPNPAEEYEQRVQEELLSVMDPQKSED